MGGWNFPGVQTSYGKRKPWKERGLKEVCMVVHGEPGRTLVGEAEEEAGKASQAMMGSYHIHILAFCVPGHLSLLNLIVTFWSFHMVLFSLRVLFVCFYVKREVKINLIKSLSDLLGISLYIIARILDHRHFAAQQSLLNQVRAGRTGL